MKLKEIAIGYIDIPLVTPFKTALLYRKQRK